MKTPETMTSNDFYKTRSYSGCISAAFDLLCSNFATIFRKTWLFAAIYSVICGLYAFIAFPTTNSYGQPSSAKQIVLTFAGTVAITLCAIVVNSRTKASFLTLINGHTAKHNFLKHIKVAFTLVAFFFVTSIIALAANMGLTHIFLTHKTSADTAGAILACSTLVVFLAFAIAALPFAYSMTKYLLHEAKAKEMFGHNYHIGFRRMGFLFTTAIIVVLTMLIINIFMALPAFIATTASQVNNFGLTYGDPSGLPSYFPWLSFVTNAIVAFILTYAMFWVDFVLCYAYGTIEADQAEKAKLQKKD